MTLYTPGHIQTATWTSPFTNRLLFEAGWGNYLSRYANSRRASTARTTTR